MHPTKPSHLFFFLFTTPNKSGCSKLHSARPKKKKESTLLFKTQILGRCSCTTLNKAGKFPNNYTSKHYLHRKIKQAHDEPYCAMPLTG